MTFTVEVAPAGAGAIGLRRRAGTAPVGGTVTISDGDTVLSVIELDAGRASFTTTSLTPGIHTITASFSGSATALPSSDTVTQQVGTTAQLPATR